MNLIAINNVLTTDVVLVYVINLIKFINYQTKFYLDLKHFFVQNVIYFYTLPNI